MWKFIKFAYEGNCELFGVNIFDYEWKNTNQMVIVKDPRIGESDEKLSIYTVIIADKEYTFATGEFSAGVYGFYVNEENLHK